MMRALIVLHRWLGVAFCLLFAMWFASGIVMHFVPFPALTESERFAGLATIDLASVGHGPAEAVAASTIADVTRVRLMQRSDGPMYLVSGPSTVKALRAADLADGAVRSNPLALSIAADDARRRRLSSLNGNIVGLASYDQWTLSGQFDVHRPLYRVALNDTLGTELYVSSVTGEVVLGTARRERAWNYFGSIAHWIYPTALRSHRATWQLVVWSLSLMALIGASAGALVGILRIGDEGARLVSPYRGLQAWHHWLGLICMVFVLTWIFSGCLSMDNGLIFSTGKPTSLEVKAITGTPDWNNLPRDEIERLPAGVREIEWFAFGSRLYRREIVGLDHKKLFVADTRDGAAGHDRAFLRQDEIDAATARLGSSCDAARAVAPDDDYAIASNTPGSLVFRAVCGDDWFNIAASNGAVLEKLDSSRRAYRWFYSALHTLDFPVLTARPALRTTLIVALCAFGFVFSLTGVVVAWRRLLSCIRSLKGPQLINFGDQR
jgi:hypothetical protein